MKCVEVYKELYHQEPFDVTFCPYSISPLGAHIDHQYGKINGPAIDKGIHMAYHPKQNGVVELQSLNFPKRAQFFVNAVPKGNLTVPPFYCYRACDVKRIQEALDNGCGYDAPGSFAAWLSKQTPMHAYVMPGKRYDIGDINSYEYVKSVFSR